MIGREIKIGNWGVLQVFPSDGLYLVTIYFSMGKVLLFKFDGKAFTRFVGLFVRWMRNANPTP